MSAMFFVLLHQFRIEGFFEDIRKKTCLYLFPPVVESRAKFREACTGPGKNRSIQSGETIENRASLSHIAHNASRSLNASQLCA
jgi:hypothetical protein